jgi:hypothetical protein
MSDYDPGAPYDDSRPRKRGGYRREDEEDDAWAAAEDDDIPDDNVAIDDLAGYYVPDSNKLDQDDFPMAAADPTDDDGLGPLPPSAKRLKQRSTIPRETRIRERYSRSQAYSDSPSFRRSQRNPINWMRSQWSGGDLAEPFRARRDPNYQPGLLSHIPFWGILILVMLGLVALLVMVLALAALLTVL